MAPSFPNPGAIERANFEVWVQLSDEEGEMLAIYGYSSEEQHEWTLEALIERASQNLDWRALKEDGVKHLLERQADADGRGSAKISLEVEARWPA